MLAIGVILLVGLLVLVAVIVPPLFVGPAANGTAIDRLRLENEVRTTLIQAIGGAALVAGLLFTYATVRTGVRALEVTREGQITQRFAQAVGQLGDTSVTIRLGAIFALERIARDSARDHGPIVEVLSAFLRDQSWSGKVLIERSSVEVAASTSRTDQGFNFPEQRLRADIQAAISVLGRRNRLLDYGGNWRLDLHQVDLRYADLRSVHLEGTILWDSHLENANITGAHLDGADLAGAHLEKASLGLATLRRCHFTSSHLEEASLFGANLEGSHLLGTHLERAVLTEARLDGASLSGAIMAGTILTGVDFRGARDLTHAQIDAAITGGDTILPDYMDGPGS